MRWWLLKSQEKRQHGCENCAHAYKGHSCPFEVCPYSELDKYARFQDYLKAKEATVPQIIRKLKA